MAKLGCETQQQTDDNMEHMPELLDLHDHDDEGIDHSRYDLESQISEQDHYRRDERVRAKKAGLWVGNPQQTIADLTIALSATGANEQYMYFLFQGQTLSSWMGHYGLKAVPLIQYARAHRSPSIRTIDYMIGQQQTSFEEVCPVLTGRSYHEMIMSSITDSRFNLANLVCFPFQVNNIKPMGA